MMRVMIMTDMEGVSEVTDLSMIENRGSQEHTFARNRLMADTNAAVRGAFDGGADEVYVVDGHEMGKNFIEGALNPRAVQLRLHKWEEKIRSGEIGAYMEVGAHAMAGTENAFLDHTQSSLSWFDYSVNGRSSGEIAQGAIFAGAFGAPFVMMSGDAAACEEGRRFFGDIQCAVVKHALGRNKARSAGADEALERIARAAKEAVIRAKDYAPYRPLLPMDIRLTYTRCDYCDQSAGRPGIERIGPRTVRRLVHKVEYYGDILF